MLATVEVTVVCTITNPEQLVALARDQVDQIKPLDDRGYYYPKSEKEALQQIIRAAIGARLLETEGVTLHEIAHKIRR